MGQHREFLDTWFQRVWNENDTSFIFEACDPKMTTEGHRKQGMLGPDDFVAFHGLINNLMDNVTIKVIRSVENGDWISGMYQVTGTKKGSDTPVEMTGNTMACIKNGKITEVYEHVDYVKFFTCLGMMPENTLEQCLSGTGINA